MNDRNNNNASTIDQEGNEVLDPRRALSEQTLSVDLARVETEQAIATAHKFPRSIDIAVKKIKTLACFNKEAAENCIYALPRGGKPIIGPSVGLASIIHQCWGNCRVSALPPYLDRKEKVLVSAGRFYDLETNAETIIPATRRAVDKQGRIYNDDMIQVTSAALVSIAERNAILRGVPRGIWHPVFLDALQIVRGTVETFQETKAKAIAAMAQFGVTPDKIFMALGLKGDIEFTLEHIPTLRGMYVSLRDGSVTVEEMFDPRRMTGKGFETVDNPLGDHAEVEETEEDATAGMGEPAGASGKADAGAAEARGAPAAEGAAKAQPAQASAQAAAAGARPKLQPAADPEPEPKKAEPPKATEPTTPAEYLAAWKEFCAGATSESAIKNQRAKDRNLRAAVGKWSPEQMDELDSIQNDRVVELRR